ncbi:MAG: ABC transporter ATP-binding protein [Candidatus Caldarchaeum sp.]
MPHILEIRGLKSGYGRIEIIHDVSLDVERGAVLAVLGVNGSGKSTLLKSIMGITNIFDGSVKLDGEELVGKKVEEIARKKIGYVPQTDNIFPNLTVRENLELGAFVGEKNVLRIDEVYRIFPELASLSTKKAALLSGGERQMLAIGRAMIGQPKILLLDEPTANLAPAITEKLRKRIREITDSGTTIVIVEQNVNIAVSIADYVTVLVSGQKSFYGTPDELSAINLQEVLLGLNRK